MANVTIYTIPLGSQLTSTIAQDEPESKNDFDVLFLWDENAELSQSKVSVSAGSSIVAFEGKDSVYKATIRPQQTAEIVTVTVAANAVSQGNPTTSKDIRVSTRFPDVDAEVPTELFDAGFSSRGIAVTPTRIILIKGVNVTGTELHRFTHTGAEQSSELTSIPTGLGGVGNYRLDFINDDFLLFRTNIPSVTRVDPTLTDRQSLSIGLNNGVHTPFGIVGASEGNIRVYPYGDTTFKEYSIGISFSATNAGAMAYNQGSLYTLRNPSVLALDSEGSVSLVRRININMVSSNGDLAIYRDTLYQTRGSSVRTLDIRKYRPLARNTKTTIYPIFANEGDIIDLTQFAPDAKQIVFDVGYRKPPFLSINANNELVVSSSAVTETSPVLVRCLGINYIDSQPFSFYIIIVQANNPIWREITSISMRAGSQVNLFDYVDADTISFRSGRTQPTDSTLSNGIFIIGKTGGRVSFTARKGSRTTHTEFDVHVIQQSDPENFSDIFRHHVEIAGIDVTADVSEFPTVSKSLDDISLNEYRANQVTLTLKSGRTNNYKYNDDVPDNFWQTNGLNPAGFQVPIHISVESLVDGEYISHLLFAGVITKATANLGQTRVELRCVDISTELQNTLVQDFGTLEKYDSLRLRTDEISFQGIYTPESSLLPMQTFNAQAWSHLTKLSMRQLALPSEGQVIEGAAYLTPQELFTSGGILDYLPILRFKSQHRSEDVRFLVKQIALNKKVYNAEIDLPAVTLDAPYLLNRGSVPFSAENTRITRLLTDWVHDPSNDRILMMLSNPEAHLADLFVEYRLNADSYRTLHTFDKDIAVHRSARRNGSNYYILTSGKIRQDLSAPQLPRHSDATGYIYDALAEGSEIKIYHYNTSSGTLTEHVAEDDTYPPQLGIHYWVGFETEIYVDEFEGIRPDYRGGFKWHSNHLYYRYAKAGEFGVARVNTSGTTTKMIEQTRLNYHNHLNFAFDITGGGAIYFVYAEGDAETSTLTIKRRSSGGSESTILTETRGIGGFNELGFDFGAFLGVHEALFHNNQLYMLCPIQKSDLGDDPYNPIADPDIRIQQLTEEKTGERNVTTSTNLNPTSTRLAPGDDIPLRIDFDGTVSGATQSDLTVYGGTIQSFSISSDMIDVTIRPDSQTRHKNIIIDLAEDAVDQGNEAWRIVVDFSTQRSREKTAGMVLYRCNVTAGSPSLTVIDKWDYVHQAGCNLTVHDGAVHYLEQSAAATAFKPINPDLDGWWTDEEQTRTMGYNTVEESIGLLKKVDTAGDVQELGNLWFEERPYNVALARCLSFNDELHLVMGYGDPQHLLRYNSLASQAQNFQHLVFGKKLHYVVPEFDTNQSRFDLLADLAKKTNATLSFREGLIRISDRSPFRAETDGQTGTGAGNLNFHNANKQLPDAGYLFIGKEILKYTGITAGAFTGIERGVLGTEVVNHATDTPILYLDTVIEAHRLKSTPSIETDTNRIYNAIRNNANTIEETDPDSITAYTERPYSLDLGLTPHESPWEEHIFKDYLANQKDPHPLIPLTLMPTNYLELEQFVAFRYADLVYAVQIVSITYTQKSTTIRGRVI